MSAKESMCVSGTLSAMRSHNSGGKDAEGAASANEWLALVSSPSSSFSLGLLSTGKQHHCLAIILPAFACWRARLELLGGARSLPVRRPLSWGARVAAAQALFLLEDWEHPLRGQEILIAIPKNALSPGF